MPPSHDTNWVFPAIAAIAGLVGLICTGGALFVRLTVKQAISELLVQINGTYVKSVDCHEKRGEDTRRLAALEANHNELYKYTHSSMHKLRNFCQIIMGKLEGLGIGKVNISGD